METLRGFLTEVDGHKEEALTALRADRAEEQGLLGFLMEEVRWGARDLGLADLRLGLEPLLRPLAGPAR